MSNGTATRYSKRLRERTNEVTSKNKKLSLRSSDVTNSLLSLLPDELWTLLLNEWIVHVKDWCSFDSALCNQSLRDQYVSLNHKEVAYKLRFQRRKKRLFEMISTIHAMISWKVSRNIKIKTIAIFAPLISFLELGNLAEIKHLDLMSLGKSDNENFSKNSDRMKKKYPNHKQFRNIFDVCNQMDLNLLCECLPQLTTFHFVSSSLYEFTFKRPPQIQSKTFLLRELNFRCIVMQHREYESLLKWLGRQCPQLQTLSFSSCDGLFLDSLLSTLSDFPSLENLCFEHNVFGKLSAPSLGNNDNIAVDLDSFRSTNFPTLTPLITLQSLQLHNITAFSNLVLLFLSVSTKLRTLSLRCNELFSPLRQEQCQQICSQYKHLHSVVLYDNCPTHFFASPRGFTSLTSLTLAQNECGDNVLQHIGMNLMNLQSLTLTECDNITSDGIRQLAERGRCMNTLKTLSLWNLHNVDANSIICLLGKLISLEQLSLGVDTDVDDEINALMIFQSLCKCPFAQSLTSLEFAFINFSLIPFSEMHGWLDDVRRDWNFRSLRKISLGDLLIDKPLLYHMFNTSPSLAEMDLSSCGVPWERHLRDGGSAEYNCIQYVDGGQLALTKFVRVKRANKDIVLETIGLMKL